jgi:hypothetical protein
VSIRCEASSAAPPIAAAKALWASSLRRQLARNVLTVDGHGSALAETSQSPRAAEPLTYNADAILIDSAVTQTRACFRKDTNGEEEQHEAVREEKRREEVLSPQGCIVAELNRA